MDAETPAYGLWLLVVMYVRLALREEREALTELGDAYRRYAERVPRFVPHLSRREAAETA
jgi:protein-S-isoprenylcysteine O-methyltransferase Ste14